MKFVFFLLLVLVALDCSNSKKRRCKGNKKALCDTILELKENVESCEEEKEALSNENKGLNSELADCKDTNEEQAKKIDELEEEIDELEKEIEELKKEIDELKPKPTTPPAPPPKNCLELFNAGETTNGVYSIDPDGQGAFDVYCDQTTQGGGYVLIQRRKDGSVDFYRGWDDYKNGFGEFGGEFWLGLDNIHRLTGQAKNELRIGLVEWDGKSAQALYNGFAVAGEDDKYRLILDSFEGGTAGDSLSFHKGMPFSTKDRDNDRYWIDCAKRYKGGWWFRSLQPGSVDPSCVTSDLNGYYHPGGHTSFSPDGVMWKSWKGLVYSAMRSAMRIRPQ